MAANKKPRKAYRPKPIAANPLAIAIHNAAKPAAQDRAQVLGYLRTAAKALREGVATEYQWSIVAGSASVALAIERQGVVRGLKDHLTSIERTLQQIYDRAILQGNGRWIRVTLRFNEIDALHDLVDLHTFQMDQLGRAEFLRAIDTAQKNTIAQGHGVAVVRDLERMAA
ncbi:MAG: hypothetical protein QE265_04885 [Rhodoferax sp.]|nr:hypothetical protein [Rhodoferax sp.]